MTPDQGRLQIFDFGEAKNFFRGRGVLKHVFDSILKISAKLFTIFLNIILMYYIKHLISLIFVIIMKINFRPSFYDFG